jgi:hypothetical protein
LKKIDIDIEILKHLDDNKLNDLEKKINEKLDNLDLNRNNFCCLFISKIIINTNKNALGNFNTQNLNEKNITDKKNSLNNKTEKSK